MSSFWTTKTIAFVVFSLSAVLSNAFPEEVSRNLPPIYLEKLAPLLTPLTKVLEERQTFTSADGSGAVLLDEEIDYVDEEGRLYNVEHLVYQALTEDGCKEVASETARFRRSDQKIHLVLAQTILPDGTRIPVQSNAAFIKTPQNREEQEIYDDGAELIIMFPNIGVGSITESITVTEQAQPRIPGEFSRRFSWRNFWPRVSTRRIVDLPDSLASRVKIISRGENVPVVVQSTPEPGRTRWNWQAGKHSAGHWEENMPPVFQMGPYTWLTTIPDWDAIARWYSGLIVGREKLSPELSSQVDEWTKGAKTPRDVINILTEKVSREIRYVALAFGLAGFQPAECNTVWANRYGDCKDKANLLRAMLLYKGIPAKIGLVETTHAGEVEKSAPDFRQFDHMILAAESGPGEWIYCDPTIRYGQAGLLSPSDSDRDVMLLDGDKAEWGRTPPAKAGTLSYEFDLEAGHRGELSGWLFFTANGYYATSYHAEYLGKERREVVRSITDYVRSFYPAAEVIDAETQLSASPEESFTYKAYFVVSAEGGDSPSTVSLPFHEGLLPDAGGEARRQTPLFLWRDNVEIAFRLELPPGATPQSTPSPYHLTAPSMVAKANWSVAGRVLEGQLKVDIKDSLVTPLEFDVFRNAIRSLQSWLQRPLLIANSDSPAAVPPTPSPEDFALDNFPMMPTAEGQRTLLEKLFPTTGEPGTRRKALRKIAQYFPKDSETQFYSAANLSFLDEKPEETVATLERLIASYRSSVEPGWILWAQYRMAFLLKDLGEKKKAQAIFSKIAQDDAEGDFRRAWSAYFAASLDPHIPRPEALALLLQGIRFDVDALASQLPLLARLLLEEGDLELLQEPLTRIAERKSQNSENGFLALIEFAGSRSSGEAEALLSLVQQISNTDTGPVAEALKNARARSRWMSTWQDVRRKLQNRLPKDSFSDDLAPKTATKEEIQKEVETALEAQQPQTALALTLILLTRFEPDDDYGERLWSAISRAEWKEKIDGAGSSGPALPLLMEICEHIPQDNDYYYEALVVKARILKRARDYSGAEAALRKGLTNPLFPSGFEISFRRDLGEALEVQGKLQEARDVYLPLQNKLAEFSSANDVFLRAVFIELHLGNRDAAIDLLQKLDQAPPLVLQKATYALQISGLVRLARNPKEAGQYWDDSSEWFRQWKTLSATLSPEGNPSAPVIVPVISDLAALGATLGSSVKVRDKAAFVDAWNLAMSAARWDPAGPGGCRRSGRCCRLLSGSEGANHGIPW